MKTLVKSIYILGFALLSSLLALDDGSYTIKVFKIGSDGVLSTTASATGSGTVSNGDGKLKNISIQNTPTNSDCRFMITNIYAGTSEDINRSSITPCPKPGDSVELGLNDLSTNQALSAQTLFKSLGSDDPISLAFGLLLTRAGDLNASELNYLAGVAKEAVSADGNKTHSFTNIIKNRLQTKYGKTENEANASIEALRSNLIFNTDSETNGSKKYELNLGGFVKKYKEAIDSTSDADYNATLGEAGGMMGKIFIAAGDAAGIPLGEILMGLYSSGDVANPMLFQAEQDGNVSAPHLRVMDAAFSAFNSTLQGYMTKRTYKDGLDTLGADSGVLSQFNSAADRYIANQLALDSQFASSFLDGNISDALKTSIDGNYTTIFTTLLKDLESNGTLIDDVNTTMLDGITNFLAQGNTNYTAAIKNVVVNGGFLDQAIQKAYYPDNTEGNMTIVQATIQKKVGNWMNDLGYVQYNRIDFNTTLLSEMNTFFKNTCTNCPDINQSFNDMNSTSRASGIASSSSGMITETIAQKALNTMTAFTAIMNDIQIASIMQWCQMKGTSTTPKCGNSQGESQAIINFQDTINSIRDNLSGYTKCTNGDCSTNGTLLSTTEKQAIVDLMQMP